jgi:hypothetical protein
MAKAKAAVYRNDLLKANQLNAQLQEENTALRRQHSELVAYFCAVLLTKHDNKCDLTGQEAQSGAGYMIDMRVLGQVGIVRFAAVKQNVRPQDVKFENGEYVFTDEARGAAEAEDIPALDCSDLWHSDVNAPGIRCGSCGSSAKRAPGADAARA